MNKERAIEIIDKGLDIGKGMLFLTVDEMNEAKKMAIDAIGRDKGRCNMLDILDKISAEIEGLDRYYDNDYFSTNNCQMYKCNEVLLIIDKYKKARNNK